MVMLGEFIPIVLEDDFGEVSTAVTATMTQVGRISASMVCGNDLEASAALAYDMTSALERLGGFLASMEGLNDIGVSMLVASGMAATFTREELGPDGDPYLEIEPTYVWVLDGWTSNDVYSNTTWNVD